MRSYNPEVWDNEFVVDGDAMERLVAEDLASQHVRRPLVQLARRTVLS